jgi:hypothetical protein
MPKALVFQEAHIQTPKPPVSKVTPAKTSTPPIDIAKPKASGFQGNLPSNFKVHGSTPFMSRPIKPHVLYLLFRFCLLPSSSFLNNTWKSC